jgi:hypothetical protein
MDRNDELERLREENKRLRMILTASNPNFFGYRKNPCMDCCDGYCTMNCGPCVPVARVQSSQGTR